jgi:hypothetical protein
MLEAEAEATTLRELAERLRVAVVLAVPLLRVPQVQPIVAVEVEAEVQVQLVLLGVLVL